MPQQVNYERPKDLNLHQEPLRYSFEAFSDAYALATVVDTFNWYEQYRTRNHDPQWNICDQLYYAWMPPRNWPGTDVPRANLGDRLVYRQVEGYAALASQALFGQPEWFVIEAELGTEPQVARAQQAHLEFALDSIFESGRSAEMNIKLGIEQSGKYGLGALCLEYDSEKRVPRVDWVDIRDLYLDPNASMPAAWAMRSVVRRKFMTMDELRVFRGDSRMKIPADDVLYTMSLSRQSTRGDNTKTIAETYQGRSYSPTQYMYSPLPAASQLEVLCYWSTGKIIWVLNRDTVIYNQPNPYGFIPVYFLPYQIIPGRPYPLGVADIQEQNQRHIEALNCGRLDNISMQILPPRAVQQGSLLTPSQAKWGPATMIQLQDPKTGINVLNPGDFTQGIFQEIAYIEQNADKATGLGGAMMGGGLSNAEGRTAAGVGAATQGGSTRIGSHIQDLENYGITPLIAGAIEMIKIHTHPDTIIPGKVTDEKGQTQFVSMVASVFSQPTRVKIRAASKMITRDKIGTAFQSAMQYLVNGPVIQSLAQAGQTLDFTELTQMFMDATGADRLYKLIRPFTDDEKKQQAQQQQQAAQSQQQPKNAADMQKAQLASQTTLQLGQMRQQTEQGKIQADMQIAQMQNAPKPPDPAEQQAAQQKHQMEMEALQAKVQADQQMNAMKAAALQQKAQVDLQGQAAKVQAAQQQSQIAAQGADRQAALEFLRSHRQIQHEGQKQAMDQQSQLDSHLMTQAGNEQDLKQQKDKHMLALKQASQKSSKSTRSKN